MMKKVLCFFLLIAVAWLAIPISVSAQASTPVKGLFESDKVLEITLTGSIKDLLNDRGDNPQLHPITVVYKGDDSSEVSIPAEGRTRGHFRKLRENCVYPPILIQFTKSDALKSSIFQEQNKLKLVTPCKDDDFVVREWLVYKLYNLVTPKSFRARLVMVKLNNAKNNKTDPPFYGILLEEESQMAKRNGLVPVTRKIDPEQAEQEAFLTLTVFEYLIGNTDWGVQYLQNIKLIAVDSLNEPTAVAYDFDHAGMVSAPYARPADELLMNHVRQRRYRGYCITDMSKFDASIALFNRIKNDIYSLYNNCNLIDEKYKKTTIQYLDEFYATINNPEKMKKEFQYPCDKNGTGHIIIGGLKMQNENE